MGIRGLWPVVTKAVKPTRGKIPVEPNTRYLVDLFGTFFTSIRYLFATNPQNPQNAINGIHSLLMSRFSHVQQNVTIFVDGHRTLEKDTTTLTRIQTAQGQLATKAQSIVQEIETKAPAGRTVSKAKRGRCYRLLWQSYHLTYAQRQALSTALRGLGWTVVLAEAEADLAIEQYSALVAVASTLNTAVISADSDFFIHPKIRAVYRPTSNQEFLFYDIAQCWNQLKLSRAKLTALGIVCHNDYSTNIHGFAVATNLSIIQGLDEGKSC